MPQCKFFTVNFSILSFSANDGSLSPTIYVAMAARLDTSQKYEIHASYITSHAFI